MNAAQGDAATTGPSLARLCELARRDQWTLDALDWASIDLSALPLEFRQTAADALAQLRHGEHTAQRAAERLCTLLPAPEARAFALTQAHDEARHVAFFDRVIAAFGCEGRVRPSTVDLMREVESATTPEELALGMQVLIEGVAHSLFAECGRIFGPLGEPSDDDDVALRSIRTIVGDWVPRLLGRDESRHIAFGLHYLRDAVPQLRASERARLEAQLARWCDMVLSSARDPDLISGVGVDGDAMCARLVDDLNLRIAQAGLSTRLTPLRADAA